MSEVLAVALNGLGANKLRSGLTILGLMIGVGSVIVLIALDLPEFERPAKAISRPVSGVSWCASAALVMNLTWG